MAEDEKRDEASAPVAEASGTAGAATTVEADAPDPGSILEADTAVVALEYDDDNDSGFGVASNASSSSSLASSILKYRVENGRTYHAYKEGSYILPNDESESERLDLQHHLSIMTTNDKLYSAPVGRDGKNVHRVLDCGTGTGIWAMDFADEHPEAHVIGIDLSPIQPSFVPPNVRFFVDDLEADWSFSEPFDFIYMRHLASSIRDWPRLFRQAYDNLRPGSWIEIFDTTLPVGCDDGSLAPDSALARWGNLMLEASTKIGSPIDEVSSYKQYLVDVGFVNVTAIPCKWPSNTWPKNPRMKELGAWAHENIMSGLQAFSLALFTRVLGWQTEALEVFLTEVRKDLRNRNVHAYWSLLNIYAQKPE